MSMLSYFVVIYLSLLFPSNNIVGKSYSGYAQTSEGPVIEWSPQTKLNWSDFKSRKNPSKGFAVAASTCGFGYDGIITGEEIKLNVYVRFYCNESWYHKNYRIPEVLNHEQLHFDICELYGRIFYKNILLLRRNGKLTERNLNNLLNEVRDEYDAMQDHYDGETSHSTDREKQKEWNRKIETALERYKAYADYKEF